MLAAYATAAVPLTGLRGRGSRTSALSRPGPTVSPTVSATSWASASSPWGGVASSFSSEKPSFGWLEHYPDGMLRTWQQLQDSPPLPSTAARSGSCSRDGRSLGEWGSTRCSSGPGTDRAPALAGFSAGSRGQDQRGLLLGQSRGPQAHPRKSKHSRAERVVYRAEDFDGRVAAGAKKEETTPSVDEYLTRAGGFGRFQLTLTIKVCIAYACLGADQMMAAFFSPALASQWGISLLEQQLLSSMWFAGGVVGFVAGGYVADIYGRRPAALYFGLLRAFCAVMVYFSPSIGWLLAARAIGSIGAAGCFNVCFPLLAEHSPPTARASSKIALALAWSIALCIQCLAALMLKDAPWQYLSIVTVPGSLITLWALSGVSESPQWLYAHHRRAEAADSLQAIAKENGVTDLVVHFAPEEEDDVEEGESSDKQMDDKQPQRPRWKDTVAELLTGEQGWRSFLIQASTGLSGAAYYGLCFAPAQNISSDIYTAQLSSALVELPSNFVTAPLADKFGRQKAQAALYFCWIVAMLVIAAPTQVVGVSAQVAALAIARGFGNAASTLKWVINAENLPTRGRGIGLAAAGVAGQLGALAGPLVFTCFPQPFLVLAVIAFLAARATAGLPETAGKDLR